MNQVTGIENLKDQFRKAKLICGDFRGLKNRWSLSEKFGIPMLQTLFYSVGGGNFEGVRMELTADCYHESEISRHAFTMKGLVEEMKDADGVWDVRLICLVWNKHRTDADRKEILLFEYSNGKIPAIKN